MKNLAARIPTNNSGEKGTIYSITVPSIPASLVATSKTVTMIFVSSTITVALKGLLSTTKIPVEFLGVISGVCAVATGYTFSGVNSAFARYNGGKLLFTGLCIGMLLGITPVLGVYNVVAIAAAQTINEVSTRALNKFYGPEKVLDPKVKDSDDLNGKVWLFSTGASCIAQVAANALLPVNGPITAAISIFGIIVSGNAAERCIMRNLLDDKSIVSSVVKSENAAKVAIAINSVLLSLSAKNIGALAANASVMSSKYLSHIFWFGEKKAVRKIAKAGLDKVLERTKVHPEGSLSINYPEHGFTNREVIKVAMSNSALNIHNR